MSNTLFDYFSRSDGCFTVPIEFLSEIGIRDTFSQHLISNGICTTNNIDLFNQAYSIYFERARMLYKKCPHYWFPPRLQHICIVTDSGLVHPYFQPYNKNSWLLYSDDLEAESSSLEFVVFQFFHIERMWLIGKIDPLLYANFSYFLTLTETQVQNFIEGCQKTTRPDHTGFRALAQAIPTIRGLYHQQLNKPDTRLNNVRVMHDTGLVVPASAHQTLGQLQQVWSKTTQSVITAHQNLHSKVSVDAGKTIEHWLNTQQPKLLITGNIDGDPNGILWAPSSVSESNRLREVFSQVSESAEPCILADLKVIDDHSRRFLKSLRQPDQLSKPASYMTEGGLSYIHKNYMLVAYNLGQTRNLTRLWQPAPPYERLMLAARTVHEWGHLAAESGWVIIPQEYQQKRQALEQSLVTLFDQIHSCVPIKIQNQIAPEVTRLQAETGSLGQTLLKRMLVRIEDYMANLVASRFLNADEMDTYVRNNVHCHLQDYSSEGLYMQLIRQAYEFQYLHLSRIENPLQWFYGSTWFVEYFVDNDIISKALFEQLTEVVGAICNCYTVDESKFDFEHLSHRS